MADEAQATIDTSALGKYTAKVNNQTLSDSLSRKLNYLTAEDKVCNGTLMHTAPCQSQICMQEHLPRGQLPMWQPQSRHPRQRAALAACGSISLEAPVTA